MTYRVEVTSAVRKQLKRLDRSVRERIERAIGDLATDPRPDGCKAMKGPYDEHFRIRVGDYRIIYRVRDAQLVVTVVEVGNRGDIY